MAYLRGWFGRSRARRVLLVACASTLPLVAVVGPAKAQTGGTVTFSGTVRDANGLALPNVWVQLFLTNNPESTTGDTGGLTGTDGNFSISPPPGTYTLEVSWDPNQGGLPNRALVPFGADFWAIDHASIPVTADTVHDVTLPDSFSQLTVKVVGPDGSPVTGAAVSYSGDALNEGTPPIPYDGATATSAVTGDSNDVSVPTDPNGQATLSFWTPAAGTTVNLSVAPPVNSDLLPGTPDNVSVSTGGTATVALATNPLTVTPIIDHPPNSSGWFNQPVTVSFRCADSDPAATVTSCPGPVTVNSEGTTPVTGTASDSVGRQATVSYSVNLDMDAPTIQAMLTPGAAPTSTTTQTQNGSGITWYRAPVTVSFECSDALSGIASCPASVLLANDGAKQSVTGVARDRAGNEASATLSGINIDMAPPTITATVTSASPKDNGWYRTPVTVHFTCSDALSGVASCPSDITLASDGTGQSVGGTAWDIAGNAASTTVGGINIDTTPPTLSDSLTSSGQLSPYGWWNAPVTVNWTCSDRVSGVATCPPSSTLTQGANQTITGTAFDVAGNSTDKNVSGINIDTTPPSATIATPNDTVVLPQVAGTTPPQVTGRATDDLSGVASVEVIFTPESGGPAQAERASVVCADTGKLSCAWTAPVPTAAGWYKVTAVASDEATNTDPRPPAIQLLVV